MDLISNFVDTLLSYRVNYNSISVEDFKHWRHYLGTTCSLFFILFFVPICLYSHKLISDRFKKIYPDEKVVYIVGNGILFLFAMMYIFGYFFGSFLVPFVCFTNLSNIQFPYHINNALFWILSFIAVFFLFIIAYSTTYIISDKRIQIITAYKICDRILKKQCFFFKDITHVSFERHYFLSELKLNFKDGTSFSLIRAFVNLKKAKAIIEEKIF